MNDDSAATGLPSPGTYRLDAGASTVRYSGKHRFGTGTVHASFAVTGGQLELAGTMAGSRVSVTVDAASFTSDSARRDKDVRSRRLLDVATYPGITFACERWRSEDGSWVASGSVTAHGRTVPVDVTIDHVVQEGADVRVHGRAEHLDRTAFGITGSRGMVGRYLDLEVDATFVAG
jgi:polyisoprenoid-binding protein YceI